MSRRFIVTLAAFFLVVPLFVTACSVGGRSPFAHQVTVTMRADTAAIALRASWTPELLSETASIIEQRMKSLGLEGTVKTSGRDKLILRFAEVKDQDEKLAQLRANGVLEFRHLVGVRLGEPPGAAATYRMDVTTDESGSDVYTFRDAEGNPVTAEKVLMESELVLTGHDLKRGSARAQKDPTAHRALVALELTPEGGKKFADFTRRNIGAALAVVLDGKILSAPVVNEPILQGRAVIQGDFNMESAGRFAALLNSGSLPAPLEIVSVQRTP